MILLLLSVFAFQARLASAVLQLDDEMPVSPQEMSALYDFYVATNGTAWDCENDYGSNDWDFDDPTANPCYDGWIGIWCYTNYTNPDPGDRYKHISMLSLSYCNMQGGYIPESIANLTLLTTLQLDNCQLASSIPNSITSLTLLDTLNLSENELTGTIPQGVSDLVLMMQLFLDTNHLHGPIPTDIGRLSTLMTLWLYENQLTGPIPSSLYTISVLSSLNLANNQLNGRLSDDVGQLTLLRALDLSANQFRGTLPATMCQLNFGTLALSMNTFVGTIPECFGGFTWMDTLDLGSNALVGSIPDSFVNLTFLGTLDLSINRLTGTLPDYFGTELTELYVLKLSDNQFHGTVGDNLCGLYTTYNLLLGSNHLTGTLPNCFDGDHLTLQLLNVSNNHFHGTIPQNLTTITILNTLDMSNNLFTGSLAEQFCLRSSISDVHLNNNQLSGEVRDCVMVLYNLNQLWMENNQFTGPLPGGEWKVQVVELSNNFFSGPSEMVVYEGSFILSLTLSNNLLSGSLPLNWNNMTNLQSLFLSNNLMSGNLDAFLVSGMNNKMLNLDLSHNHFSGTLPPHLFQLPSMESFAAVSNCLHGSLPSAEICALTNLTTLALDGLMSSTHCQDRLVPYSTSYAIEKTVTGGVPACMLYDMQSLQILHLSGNGMTGTIPDRGSSGDNDVISVSLQDLSLSHNELTGTIPLSIQQHTWTALDLSYNKLTGTLKGSIYDFEDDSANDDDQPQLSLQVNRLSGPVPAALLAARNISILDGNLFSCFFDRTDLPKHDSDASVYECGSNSFNYAVYIWLIFAILMGTFAVLLWMTRQALKRESIAYRDASNSSGGNQGDLSTRKRMKKKTTLVYVSEHITAWQQVFTPTAEDTSAASTTTGGAGVTSGNQLRQRRSLVALGYFIACVRAGFLRLTLFIVCFLMPLYAALTQFYNTYTYEYAWTLSTSYLSGITAGVTIMLLLILLLVLTFAYYAQFFYSYLNTIGPISLITTINRGDSSKNESKWPLCWYLSLALVAMLNVILVMAVNVGYVFVNITYSGTIVRLTQVSVAAFKLGWNSGVLRRILKWTRKFLYQQGKAEEDVEVEVPLTRMSAHIADVGSNHSGSVSQRVQSGSTSGAPAQHIGVEVCLVLFNNIAAPFIATLFVSSNCFYNVIVSPPKVDVIYAYSACNKWQPHGKYVYCEEYTTFTRETSYDPPFTYSYQCSSTIVSYYAAIYVFMLLFIGFLVPAVQCAVKLIQQISDRRGSVYATLNHFLPVLLRSRKKDHPLPANEPGSSADPPTGIVADRPVAYSSDNSSSSLSLLRLLNAGIVAEWDTDDVRKLFECDLFIIRIINLLSILLTFGAVFPPLAIVVCVALFNFSYFTQILIGRFINVAHSKGHLRVSELLAQQCDHAALMFTQSVWIVIPFAVLFYSLFVLDTLGDTPEIGGWEAAIWAPVVLCLSPLVIWLVQTRGRCNRGEGMLLVSSGSNRRSGSKSEDDVRRRFNSDGDGGESGVGSCSGGSSGVFAYVPVEDEGGLMEEGHVASSSNPLLNRLLVNDDDKEVGYVPK